MRLKRVALGVADGFAIRTAPSTPGRSDAFVNCDTAYPAGVNSWTIRSSAPQTAGESRSDRLKSAPETVRISADGTRPYRSEERRVGKEGRSRWSPYH